MISHKEELNRLSPTIKLLKKFRKAGEDVNAVMCYGGNSKGAVLKWEVFALLLTTLERAYCGGLAEGRV